MSTHSTEAGSGQDNGSLTSDQLARANEERAEDRDTSAGGRLSGTHHQSFIAESRSRRKPRPSGNVRGYYDGEREELGDGSRLTDEERALSLQRLAEVRVKLGIGVVADLPTPPPRVETLLPEIPQPREATTMTHRELGAIARQLAMETGITHRVTSNSHGDLIVEPVQKVKK